MLRGAKDNQRQIRLALREPSAQGVLAGYEIQIKLPAFYDISHWKVVNNWYGISPAPLTMGTKATEGTYYKDATFPEYFTKFKTILGCKVRVAYHFFRKSNDAVAQANWFVDYIEPYITDDDILVLDFEEGGETASQLWAFLNRVAQRRPRNLLMIYSRANLMNAIVMTESEKTFFKKIPTWVAGYPNDPNAYSTTPSFYKPDPTKWGQVWGWQYTDSAQVEGIDGDTDANLMEQPFIDYCGGVAQPPEPPPVEGDGMKIYTGTVKSTATPYVTLRDAPYGAPIGKLYPNMSFEGKGELVYSNGYYRMEITKYNGQPISGWAASEFLDYTVTIVPDPPVNEGFPPSVWIAMEEGGELKKYDLAV